MQTAGGGIGFNGAGRRKANLRARYNETSQNATPGHRAIEAPELVDALNQLKSKDVGNAFSHAAGDVAKQVYMFPGKLYENADRDVRGLIDIGTKLFQGKADPGLVAEDMARGTLHDITHPVEFALDRPLDFALMAAGGLAGASKLPGLARAADARLALGTEPVDATAGSLWDTPLPETDFLGRPVGRGFGGVMDAEYAGNSVGSNTAGALESRWPGISRLLNEERGAIGPIGRRLEQGEAPLEMAADRSFLGGGGASNPYLVKARWGTGDTADLVAKADPLQTRMRTRYSPITGESYAVPPPQNQALNEAAVSDLNVYTGSRVRMPGVLRGEVPYREGGTGAGSLQEFIPNLQKVEEWPQFNYENPVVTEQMRGMNILDRVIGNDDRAFGANLHATEGPEGLIPIAVDQGIAFKPKLGLDTMYDPHAWGGVMNYNPEMAGFNPTELDWIRNLLSELRNPQGAALREVADIRPAGIRGAIDRALQLLEDKRMNPDFEAQPWMYR